LPALSDVSCLCCVLIADINTQYKQQKTAYISIVGLLLFGF